MRGYPERLLVFSRWRSHISEKELPYSAESPSSGSTPRRSLRSFRSSMPGSAGSRRTLTSFSGAPGGSLRAALAAAGSARGQSGEQPTRFGVGLALRLQLLPERGDQLLGVVGRLFGCLFVGWSRS